MLEQTNISHFILLNRSDNCAGSGFLILIFIFGRNVQTSAQVPDSTGVGTVPDGCVPAAGFGPGTYQKEGSPIGFKGAFKAVECAVVPHSNSTGTIAGGCFPAFGFNRGTFEKAVGTPGFTGHFVENQCIAKVGIIIKATLQ